MGLEKSEPPALGDLDAVPRRHKKGSDEVRNGHRMDPRRSKMLPGGSSVAYMRFGVKESTNAAGSSVAYHK